MDRLLFETTFPSGKTLRIVQRHGRVALELSDGARMHVTNLHRDIIGDVIAALVHALDDEQCVHHAWAGEGPRPPGVPRGRVRP